MNAKNNIWLKYLEAIVYSIVLMIGIYFGIFGSTIVKMIPIALIIGIAGNLTLRKKYMTAFFCGILAIILLQIKTPSNMIGNILNTAVVVLSSLLGEIIAMQSIKIYKLFKLKKNKKKVKEKVISIGVTVALLILALGLNGVVNGDYISYFKAKNSLKNFLMTEYNSKTRFKILYGKYQISSSPRYTFYTLDTVKNNELGKFVIYTKDLNEVQDEYEEILLRKEVENINANLSNIDRDENTIIMADFDNANTLTINITKTIPYITNEEAESFARDTSNQINEIISSDKINLVEQFCITLNSYENEKDNISSYIFVSGYKDMLKNGEVAPYEYIMHALNFELIE